MSASPAHKTSPPMPYKTVLVTGASRGLGEAFAKALLASGCTVYGTSRTLANLQHLVGAYANFHALELDVLNMPQTQEALADIFPGGSVPVFNLVVHSAGFGHFGSTLHAPQASLAQQTQGLLTAPMQLTQLLLPSMMQSGQPCAHVYVASLAGHMPMPFYAPYNAAKAGLSQFAHSLLLDAQASGWPLQVIDLQLGDFNTQFNNAAGKNIQLSAAEETAWAALQKHLVAGPAPQHAAKTLLRALRRGTQGTVRSGTFFQAQVAARAWAFMPGGLRRWALKKYYQL